jgi:glucose/arabinose dehydrogenase
MRIASIALAIATLTAGVVTRAQAPAGAHVFETDNHTIRLVPIADGLSDPWSIAFLPNGDMLVTERSGGLRLIHNGVLQPQPVTGTPMVRYRNHGGLMDIALHPNYATNHFVYLTYSKIGEKGATTALWRATFDGTRLVDAKDIFVADAWTTSDVNFGSRLLFDRAGFLFMTIGERNFPFPQNQGMSAQDLNTHMGKILRLRDDGTVPPDNPFVGQPDKKPEIFSYGHRNPQGLTIHPTTGAIWATEHGPMGGDEANLIQAGKNYGWPFVTYGRGYDSKVISDNPVRDGMELPRYFWVPSLGITNLFFYTGDRFAKWKGQLFVAGHGAKLLQRVRQEGRGTNERESVVTPAFRRRFRDARQGPDGFIYLVADNKDEKMNTGTVYRMEPAD